MLLASILASQTVLSRSSAGTYKIGMLMNLMLCVCVMSEKQWSHIQLYFYSDDYQNEKSTNSLLFPLSATG